MRSHRPEPPRWDSNPQSEVHDRLQSPRRQPLTGFGCQVGNVPHTMTGCLTNATISVSRTLLHEHTVSLNAGPDNHLLSALQTRRGIWSCVGCAYWSTVGNLARIPRIGRERRQVPVNSAHVRADMHVCNGAGGGWWKEAKAGVVVKKLLLLLI